MSGGILLWTSSGQTLSRPSSIFLSSSSSLLLPIPPPTLSSVSSFYCIWQSSPRNYPYSTGRHSPGPVAAQCHLLTRRPFSRNRRTLLRFSSQSGFCSGWPGCPRNRSVRRMAMNRIRGAFAVPRKGETFELRAGLVYAISPARLRSGHADRMTGPSMRTRGMLIL